MSQIISLDLNITCRLCLSQEGYLPLFSDIELQEESNSLAKKILACVGIEVSPDSILPKTICEICKKTVDDWERFKEQSVRVNTSLQQFLDNHKSAQYIETLRSNLGGATSSLLFSDVDGSIFEKESLFGPLEDGLQVDSPNISLSDDLLSENPQPISASNVLSPTLSASSAINKLMQLNENTVVGKQSSLKLSADEPESSVVVNDQNTFKPIVEDKDENLLDGNQNTFKLIEGLLECKQHDDNNEYFCELCEEEFPDFVKLVEHDDSIHNEIPKKVSCPVCGKCFLSGSRITLHVLEDNCSLQVVDITPKNRFPCEFCGKDFIKFSRLLHHDSSHHSEIPKDSRCEECDKLFISENRVNIHKKHVHKFNKNVERYKKQYTCGLCENSFLKFVDLLKHDDTHHAKLPRNFSCEVCGKLFLSVERIDIHKRIHGERKFQCTICDKMFLTPKSLSVHARGHKDKFVCDFCGSRKQSLRMLQDHVRVHTQEKPFACQLCGKTFSSIQGKQVHEKRYHLNNKNFKCDVCDYRAYSFGSMEIHKQTHNVEKQFKCEQCEKLFQTRRTYLNHTKIHKEYNPTYKCLVCSAVFREKYFLTRHEALHLNLRQFSCYICDNTFNRKDLLRAHIRLHMTKMTHCCEKCKKSFKTQRYLKKHRCAASRETLVETQEAPAINSSSNPDRISHQANFVQPQEIVFTNVDNRVVVTNAVDNIENATNNLNNSLFILNDGSLILINPPVVCKLNDVQTASLPFCPS